MANKSRKLSAAGREKISQAAKKRWAKFRSHESKRKSADESLKASMRRELTEAALESRRHAEERTFDLPNLNGSVIAVAKLSGKVEGWLLAKAEQERIPWPTLARHVAQGLLDSVQGHE